MQQSLFGSLAGPVVAEEKPTVSLSKVALCDAVFSVLDLETTGLNAKRNAITEVTAIQYKNGVEIGKYSTLIKPTEAIPEEVELLTGISNDMVKNAPALVMALSELSAFLGPSPIIVGHNVSFDIGFLKEKISQSGLDVFADRYDLSRAFCTKVLAQKALPSLPSYEGIVVATAVGYHNPNPHRAEADVRMSAAILFALIEKLQAENAAVKTVQDLLIYQGVLSER
ncbi:3'-5' exonuclease [Vampirovibrio chlorellavorus]|uniref:3'-5' exonuclease n=1 Tax=Vampirovibrio chlorellavorus TaxID=758823 RepID=UPI0026EDB0DA|nr:3'-5' exonuclease [Vampirovibrio chlorellavorus]